MVKQSNKNTGTVFESPVPKKKLDRAELEKLGALFGAFADATRLAILQELRQGRLSVGELVSSLGTSQANISKHLKILHQAGLLLREREGLQVFYKVAEESIYEMCQFACKRLNQRGQQSWIEGDYFI